MIVYIVLYLDIWGDWKVGNVYANKQDAREEADERDGIVLTKQVR